MTEAHSGVIWGIKVIFVSQSSLECLKTTFPCGIKSLDPQEWTRKSPQARSGAGTVRITGGDFTWSDVKSFYFYFLSFLLV